MVPASNLLTFAIAAFLLIAVPGPSVLFVIGRALALGRKGGLLSVLGNALGERLQIAAVALGVGVVLAQSIVLFSVVKFAGAAYLIYLGILDYEAGAIPLQLGTLGALFLAIALVSDSAWALTAGTARHWFASSLNGASADLPNQRADQPPSIV